ncbi:GDSL-like Lipase/Acylhydrolase family protein [Nitrosomonas aestuarii]|uniref:GDSL-like Lipase/Acylhydrolase family protein n=1 Tax=Nitrosomonas aestuarii TaxID=52441 RepID=A0A1I4GCT9_9PROT|nr:SGNH/GDSL hydrolase family protein [Nitrosomonas aestuarii]SFL27855.1 GDSL-like Lipase/Acylhydrolase family protein [Nitrosomonas aestuarii]
MIHNIFRNDRQVCNFSWSIQITLIAGLLASLVWAPLAQADCDRTTIMSAGDSMTLGYNKELQFAVKPGYRGGQGGLRGLLADRGLLIDYVGSRDEDTADPCNDLAHESMEGRTISAIDNLRISDITPWKTYTPDIVLLMAGTNDFLNNYNYCEATPRTRFEAFANVLLKIDAVTEAKTGLIENILGESPATQLFVSSIPPINVINFTMACQLPDDEPDPSAWLATRQGNLNAEIDKFNQAVKQRVTDYGLANLHFVDVGSTLSLSDYEDGVHPKDLATFHKMAPAWFSGIISHVQQKIDVVGDRDNFQGGDAVDSPDKSVFVMSVLDHIATDPGQNPAADLDTAGSGGFDTNRPVGFTHSFALPPGALVTAATLALRVKGSAENYNDSIIYDQSALDPLNECASSCLRKQYSPQITFKDLLGREPVQQEVLNLRMNLAKVPVRIHTQFNAGDRWPGGADAHHNLLGLLSDGEFNMIVVDDTTVDYSQLTITYVLAGTRAGELNGDGVIDIKDIDILRNALNTDAYSDLDPRDIDGDGRITILDMRKLVLQCDHPRCAAN